VAEVQPEALKQLFPVGSSAQAEASTERCCEDVARDIPGTDQDIGKLNSGPRARLRRPGCQRRIRGEMLEDQALREPLQIGLRCFAFLRGVMRYAAIAFDRCSGWRVPSRSEWRAPRLPRKTAGHFHRRRQGTDKAECVEGRFGLRRADGRVAVICGALPP